MLVLALACYAATRPAQALEVAGVKFQPQSQVKGTTLILNGAGVRQQATGRVAEWHDRYGRRQESRADKSGLGNLAAETVRTCANGELVTPMAVAVA